MNWFAIYTKSKFEKKVYSLLLEQSIEAYLPLQKKLHQWSDRKKWIECPLINSYVFVRITEKDYFRVLNTPGVVCYVTFSGKAAPIRDAEIDILKRILSADVELKFSTEDLQIGEEVEIISGKLLGLQGELVEYKGGKRVIVRIGNTGHNLLLTIPTNHLRRRLALAS
ncbi:UpxY family transcription antiterminator [Rhodocytophaga aerolata]|uniref:UpxY family transcription antiterminator n=1 Tax=Rhodocytophaga aerolata TaxID=455078 RepID=A0ABT8REL3_9BACT|nr:UpxY family transcription antiterminator [Rhodocytophaga aerolata]MDO1449784.1 UpxY family transcription antiterminator [Rhodocytophaga aerolata]